MTQLDYDEVKRLWVDYHYNIILTADHHNLNDKRKLLQILKDDIHIKIYELAQEGTTYIEMSKILGLSVSRIADRVKKYNIRTFNEEMIKKYNLDHSLSDKDAIKQLFDMDVGFLTLHNNWGIYEVWLPLEKVLNEQIEEKLTKLAETYQRSEICNILELPYSTYARLLKKYKIKPPKMRKPDPRLIVFDYIRLMPIPEIKVKYHIHSTTINKILTKFGIPIETQSRYRSKISNHINETYGSFDIETSIELEELFVGQLIGDGNITLNLLTKDGITGIINNPKNTPSIKKYRESLENLSNIMTSKVDLDSLTDEHLTKLIQLYITSFDIILKTPTAKFRIDHEKMLYPWLLEIKRLTELEGLSANVNVKETTVSFNTTASIQLQKLYYQFYTGKNFKKRIPRNLSFTPEIVLHWFLGDGGYYVEKYNHKIQLNCQGLPEKDVELLQLKLESTLNILVHLYQRPENKGTDKGFYLQIAIDKDVRKFLRYISQGRSIKVAKKVFKWKFSDLKYFDYKKKVESVNI